MRELPWGHEKLNENTHTPPSKGMHESSGGQRLPARGRNRLVSRAVRFVLATVICIVLVAISGAAGIYFLLQGETGKGSAVVSRIEAGLQDIVGDDFEVELQNADLDFAVDGKLGFKSNDILITRKVDNRVLAKVGRLTAKVSWLDAIAGLTTLELVRLEDASLDASVLSSGRGLFLPSHLQEPFDAIGVTLHKFQQSLDEERFKRFEIINSTIKGPVLARKQLDSLRLNNLNVAPDGEGRFLLDAELATERSGISVRSTYQDSGGNGSRYSFSATGINMREWFGDPLVEEGVIGSDAIVDVEGEMPFDLALNALDPTLNIKSSESVLRLGRTARTDVSALDLNFRLILAKNQIELDPSEIEMGRLKAKWVGGIRPYNPKKGYAGSLRYDLIMSRGEFEPTLEGEPIVPAAFKVAGLYDAAKRDLLIDKIILTTKSGSVTGKGRMVFQGETPSLRATASTDGLSAAAIKQFWPFFMAGKAREWIHSHFIDGWVESGTLEADIPPGVIFRIRDGAKMKPEEFKLDLKMKDVSFRPFGQMPPIQNAVGDMQIEGMKISSQLDSGTASTDGRKPVKIKSGSFVMKDFAAKARFGETKLSLEGDVQTIAAIADRKPLRVMERMKVTPSQFSGFGHADIVANFPVGRKAEYSEIDWNVLLDLQNGASSKLLDGRKFSETNILIDATPLSAKVTGTARIDGIKSKVKLVEPIGKSGKAKRSREVVVTLDEKARKELGIDVDGVVDGPVIATISQFENVEKYNLDFSQSQLALPWVGWTKGKGIAAKAEFDLRKKDKAFYVDNFELKGDGFFGAGNLVMDKRGLILGDIKSLKLNANDDLGVKIERTKNGYVINASGSSYDARGVMNMLIHKSSFASAQGDRSVKLVANFNQVTGFSNRTIENASMTYESRGGRLVKLDVKGQGAASSRYSVQAQRNGNQTLFTISSNNAGNALAFLDIYSRMEGGVLEANLVQSDNGPFIGPVRASSFTVVNEKRLESLVSNVRRQIPEGRGERQKIIPLEKDQRVNFILAQADIQKGDGYLNLGNGILRSPVIGLTLEGALYDKKDRMNLSGTFMPANGINLAVSAIPILGQLFSNGRDNALIGITYQLRGPRENPELLVNPLSIVAPGIFNKVFEFK